jgi:hypothetical protein
MAARSFVRRFWLVRTEGSIFVTQGLDIERYRVDLRTGSVGVVDNALQ